MLKKGYLETKGSVSLVNDCANRTGQVKRYKQNMLSMPDLKGKAYSQNIRKNSLDLEVFEEPISRRHRRLVLSIEKEINNFTLIFN